MKTNFDSATPVKARRPSQYSVKSKKSIDSKRSVMIPSANSAAAASSSKKTDHNVGETLTKFYDQSAVYDENAEGYKPGTNLLDIDEELDNQSYQVSDAQ